MYEDELEICYLNPKTEKKKLNRVSTADGKYG